MMQNEKSPTEVYYGLHFCPGVAEYAEEGKEPYRIFINEATIRKMNPTFQGRPVYVQHVDKVDVENLRETADGYVIDSFYNAADGKTWVKFIVVSEEGKRAIKNGWRLSNAYVPKSFGSGGLWNGVEYAKEVTDGEYEHLAIVPNPRYEESVIMTPQEFKNYNESKELELKKLANSKDQKGEKSVLNIFKRVKVENAVDLESTVVELPKSKKEMTIAALVNEMDKVLNMHGYAANEHMVKVGNAEMSVGDLVKKHMDMCNEMEEMKKAKDEKNEQPEEHEKMPEVEKASNEKAEEEEKEEEAKKNAKEKAALLKNANKIKDVELKQTIDLPQDKLARGRELF